MAGPSPLRPGAWLIAGLWPFAAGAAAVNLFFASLLGSWLGLPVLDPWTAVAGGALLGWPAAWAFALHLRRLMAKADGAEDAFDA